jgi:CHRD domain
MAGKRYLWALVVGLIAALAFGTYAIAGGKDGHVKAEPLRGYSEVPAVSTQATGKFEADINDAGTAITYTETYSGLESDATQSHIHFGQKNVTGGISVWLCSNLASPPTPAGVQACPLRAGTVTGTLTAANVVGPAGQGISAGEFAELVKAIRAGIAYANVHSVNEPGGEIRGQLKGHPKPHPHH